MANRYIIFGRETCPFCTMAMDFCKASHISHLFLNYEENREILEDYKEFYKQDTVPIILENNMETGLTQKVGGYSDLLNRLEGKVEKSDETNKKKFKSKRKLARKK